MQAKSTLDTEVNIPVYGQVCQVSATVAKHTKSILDNEVHVPVYRQMCEVNASVGPRVYEVNFRDWGTVPVYCKS